MYVQVLLRINPPCGAIPSPVSGGLAFWFSYSVTSDIHLVGNAKAAGKPAAEKQPAQKSKGHAHPERRRARGSSALLVYLSDTTPRPSSALHLARCFPPC